MWLTQAHLFARANPIRKTNVYMSSKAPWSLVTTGHSNEPKVLSSEEEAELDGMIYLCSESIRICGILLQPYMPAKMQRLLDMLGVREERRTVEFAHVGTDKDYGESNVALGKGVPGTLFPPLALEEIEWNLKADKRIAS